MARSKRRKRGGNPQHRPQNGDTPQKTQPPHPIASVVAAEGQPPAQHQVADSRSSPPAKQQQLETPRWWRKWRNWQKVFVVGEILLATAIAWFAFVQANIGRGQLGAMVKQNEEIIKQNTTLIKQTKAMTEQTNLAKGQLEQMRLEQRAWVSHGQP
jgi:hypothetical protein